MIARAVSLRTAQARQREALDSGNAADTDEIEYPVGDHAYAEAKTSAQMPSLMTLFVSNAIARNRTKTKAEITFVVVSYEAGKEDARSVIFLLPSGLQLGQLAIDLAFFFHGGELAVHVIGKKL